MVGGIIVAVVGACAWAAMHVAGSAGSDPERASRAPASTPVAGPSVRSSPPTERLADDVSPAPAESFLGAPPRREGTELPVLFDVPPFDVREARGGTVSLASLSGTVWVTNFIFTQCTTVCPTMTARFTQLQRRLRSSQVRFVSMSVDPEHDTLEALREFLAHWPHDPRWLVLSANRDQLTSFAHGMRVAVVPGDDPKNPILHSRLLTLVDREGRVRGVYDSDDEMAWTRLAADAEELVRGLPGAPVAAATPSSADPLQRHGCNGCHQRPGVAPALSGGDARLVRLASGETKLVDDAYLRESILSPAANVVAGYPPSMPRYRLANAEVSELVAAIHRLPELVPASAPPRAPEVDPICHMVVSTADPALTLRVGDQELHFCSHRCLEAFVVRPREVRREAP